MGGASVKEDLLAVMLVEEEEAEDFEERFPVRSLPDFLCPPWSSLLELPRCCLRGNFFTAVVGGRGVYVLIINRCNNIMCLHIVCKAYM